MSRSTSPRACARAGEWRANPRSARPDSQVGVAVALGARRRDGESFRSIRNPPIRRPVASRTPPVAGPADDALASRMNPSQRAGGLGAIRSVARARRVRRYQPSIRRKFTLGTSVLQQASDAGGSPQPLTRLEKGEQNASGGASVGSANDETLFVQKGSVFGSELNPPISCVFGGHRLTSVRAVPTCRTGPDAKLR